MKKIAFWLVFTTFCLVTLTAATKKSTAGVTLLEQTTQAFTEIAEKAMPATVYIKAEIVQTSPQPQELLSPFDMFGDEFFKRFFGGGGLNGPQREQQQRPQIAGGSGFLITADGFVVTNNHVIQDATNITVTLNDGREYEAIVKGADPRTDLALLKIEETNLPFLTFGDSDSLKIGEWVIAIGNPFGIGATMTAGIVSAKGRQDLGIASYEDFIQTDAAINPGNSGGPLFNLKGEVIGVNTAIFTRSGGYMGIGLSIPSQMVQTVIEQIMETGIVKRGYLGVILQMVDKDLGLAIDFENQDGVLVSEVVKGSAAEKAGLRQGDIILQCNSLPAKNVSKLRKEIAMLNPGTEVTLQILRDKKKITVQAVLGSLEGIEVSAELITKIGVEIENLTPETASRLGYSNILEGIAIAKVKPGSPAAQAGLRSGYLITGVAVNWDDQKPVKNVEELEEALKEIGDKKHLILIIRHQNYQRYYTIKLG